MAINQRLWNPEEIDSLKNYLLLGYTDIEIAEALSRSYISVFKKRSALNLLVNKKKKEWSGIEEQTLRDFVNQGKTDKEISEILDRSFISIRKKRWKLGLKSNFTTAGENNAMFGKKHSAETRVKMSQTPRATGEDHGSWTGGRINFKNKYIKVFKPDHHRASKGGYVFEHILIAEEKYGFPIKFGEWDVHHVDNNGKNNDPNNLLLIRPSAHIQFHGLTKEKLKKICPNCNELFKVKPSLYEKRVYCSRECYLKAVRGTF